MISYALSPSQIAQRFPKPRVAGSIPAGGTRSDQRKCESSTRLSHIGSGSAVSLRDTAPAPGRHWLRYLCPTGTTHGCVLIFTCALASQGGSRAVTEQAANADDLVDEALDAGLDGSHPITVHTKMLRLELLNVKKELERELETLVLNCSKCGLDVH